MKKRTCYTEAAYLLGLVILALATALMEKAGFGLSMVVAPAYLVHLKVSQTLPFFSFGMAEYTFQALLLIVLVLAVRRFRVSYLFSFCTAVLYGLLLDGALWLASPIPGDVLWVRIVCYVVGLVVCSLGVSLLFHTYISPEAYELFVKELTARYGFDIHKCKTVYDCVSCAVGVALSFLFFGFGRFEGVNWGTVVCALVNGWVIGRCTHLLEKRFEFKDALPLRKYFE